MSYLPEVFAESLLPLLLLLLGDTAPLDPLEGNGEDDDCGGWFEGVCWEEEGAGGDGGFTRYIVVGRVSCLYFRDNRLPGGDERCIE